MARPLGIEYPDAVYPVMNRGLARQATFCTHPDYETFLQMPGETHTLCAASRRGVGRGGLDLNARPSRGSESGPQGGHPFGQATM